MAQMVERLLLNQRSVVQIQSSAKFIEHLFTVNCIEKTKIKKEAGNGPFFKMFVLRRTERRVD